MNQRKKCLIVLIVLISCFLTARNTHARTIKWLDGTWEGQKYQSNMDKAWKMKLSINTRQNHLTVEYPELSCKGNFIIQSVKCKTVTLVEKINSGDCVNDGYIIITYIAKNLITFTCLRDNKTRLASYCTLERK